MASLKTYAKIDSTDYGLISTQNEGSVTVMDAVTFGPRFSGSGPNHFDIRNIKVGTTGYGSSDLWSPTLSGTGDFTTFSGSGADPTFSGGVMSFNNTADRYGTHNLGGGYTDVYVQFELRVYSDDNDPDYSDVDHLGDGMLSGIYNGGSTWNIEGGGSFGSGPVKDGATWQTVNLHYQFPAAPSISLSPTTGYSPSTISVSGSNFAASSALQVKFGTGAFTSLGTSDGAGSFSGLTFSVPSGLTQGASFTVTVKDASSNQATATFTVLNAITITPSTETVGTPASYPFTVQVNGTAAGQALTLQVFQDEPVRGTLTVASGTTPFTSELDVVVLPSTVARDYFLDVEADSGGSYVADAGVTVTVNGAATTYDTLTAASYSSPPAQTAYPTIYADLIVHQGELYVAWIEQDPSVSFSTGTGAYGPFLAKSSDGTSWTMVTSTGGLEGSVFPHSGVAPYLADVCLASDGTNLYLGYKKQVTVNKPDPAGGGNPNINVFPYVGRVWSYDGAAFTDLGTLDSTTLGHEALGVEIGVSHCQISASPDAVGSVNMALYEAGGLVGFQGGADGTNYARGRRLTVATFGATTATHDLTSSLDQPSFTAPGVTPVTVGNGTGAYFGMRLVGSGSHLTLYSIPYDLGPVVSGAQASPGTTDRWKVWTPGGFGTDIMLTDLTPDYAGAWWVGTQADLNVIVSKATPRYLSVAAIFGSTVEGFWLAKVNNSAPSSLHDAFNLRAISLQAGSPDDATSRSIVADGDNIWYAFSADGAPSGSGVVASISRTYPKWLNNGAVFTGGTAMGNAVVFGDALYLAGAHGAGAAIEVSKATINRGAGSGLILAAVSGSGIHAFLRFGRHQ